MTETQIIKLDYTLKTPEERTAHVQKIIDAASPSQLTNKYLEILSDYILDALPKTEKREHYITTNNRQLTIDKRETSYEGLVSKFENGEDGVYNLISYDKNQYLSPKVEITEEDIAEVPGLAELRENIEKTEAAAKLATGKKKYLLKKHAIEMRQEQYILKNMWHESMHSVSSHNGNNPIELEEKVYFDENGDPTSDAAITFFKPEHISAILQYYESLSIELRYKFNSDFSCMLRDFDKLMAEALVPYPAYQTLVEEKIAGRTNANIQKILLEKHNLFHTPEYISSLWKNKIPKILSNKAKSDYLIWYYTEVEKGQWKKCSKCGEYKLAHNRFFSKNNTSKDGFYSICKACRNKKK